MGIEIWPTIHAERKALAADLSGLSDEQWKTPSMCDQWTVHDVLGHMVATAKKTPPGFFASFIGAGFNFDRMVGKDVAKETAGGPSQTLAEFEAVSGSTSHPPGPNPTWLGEMIIHGEDIRRPLGLTHTVPEEALAQVLDFYKGSNLVVGAKKRIAGLNLEATDIEWSTGSGPKVSGPGMSLLLAMTGRRAGLDDLTGDGASTLASRCS